jgi:hypothetical protein
MNGGGGEIVVRSHVARDLLQNAALFKTDKLVVWECVSNGLQYVDPGVNPIVRVTLDSKPKRIEVADNGRGMDWAGLQNFFIMHGENLDRMEGRPGRGRFGTGKSAAFGIAETLRVASVQRARWSRSPRCGRLTVARNELGGAKACPGGRSLTTVLQSRMSRFSEALAGACRGCSAGAGASWGTAWCSCSISPRGKSEHTWASIS